MSTLHFNWLIFMLSSPLMFLSLVLYPAVSPGAPFPAGNLSRVGWQALVLGSLLFTFQSVCFYLIGSVCSDLQPQFCFQLPVEVYRGCYLLTNQLDRFSNSVDLEDNQKAPLLGSKSNVPGLIFNKWVLGFIGPRPSDESSTALAIWVVQ